MDYATIFNNTGGGVLLNPLGVANHANAVITRTTFDSNTISGTAGGGAGLSDDGTPLSLKNSTFYGNTGPDAGGIGVGSATVYIVNCTVTQNTQTKNPNSGSAGGLLVGNSSDHVYIRNTIILGNINNDASQAPEVATSLGSVVSTGHNLIGLTSLNNVWQATDQINKSAQDANLGPLGDHGGVGSYPNHPKTVPLGRGSVAIDNGDQSVVCTDTTNPYCVGTTDERGPGFVRQDDPSDNAVEVGAFEVQPGAMPTSSFAPVNVSLGGNLEQGRTEERSPGPLGPWLSRSPDVSPSSYALAAENSSLPAVLRPGAQPVAVHVYESPSNSPELLPNVVG
jgi:hypothetical protein